LINKPAPRAYLSGAHVNAPFYRLARDLALKYGLNGLAYFNGESMTTKKVL
jgi:hypothetical protein